MMTQAITKYTETFKENFPMFLVQAADEAQVLAIINQCLKTNRPYRPPIDKNVKY